GSGPADPRFGAQALLSGHPGQRHDPGGAHDRRLSHRRHRLRVDRSARASGVRSARPMARPMSARPAAASAPPALAATGAAPPPPAAAEAPAAFPGLAARPAAGFWVASLRRFLRNRFALSALGALLLLVALSFAAPLIGRALGVDRDAIELLDNYQPPSARHWLGTDEYGRDYFIRLLYGGQVSILMGLGVAAIILAIGVPLGILAGYYGGALDDLFNWIVQILISVPRIPLYILVAAWLPPTPPSLALLLGSLAWPGNALQARGLTFSL